MPFINRPNGKFTNEEKAKILQLLGSVFAVVAVLCVILLETGLAGELSDWVDKGLVAMIVLLALSLAGSWRFKK